MNVENVLGTKNGNGKKIGFLYGIIEKEASIEEIIDLHETIYALEIGRGK